MDVKDNVKRELSFKLLNLFLTLFVRLDELFLFQVLLFDNLLSFRIALGYIFILTFNKQNNKSLNYT